MPGALAASLELAIVQGDTSAAEKVRAEFVGLGVRHPEWHVTQLMWRRLEKDQSSVERLVRAGPQTGYVAARGLLELARVRLENGHVELANEALRDGHRLAADEGLKELQLYARMVAGGTAPLAQRGWDDVLKACNRASWVELFLGILEFEGRRRRAADDEDGAIASFRALHRRAADLGHEAYEMAALTLMAR